MPPKKAKGKAKQDAKQEPKPISSASNPPPPTSPQQILVHPADHDVPLPVPPPQPRQPRSPHQFPKQVAWGTAEHMSIHDEGDDISYTSGASQIPSDWTPTPHSPDLHATFGAATSMDEYRERERRRLEREKREQEQEQEREWDEHQRGDETGDWGWDGRDGGGPSNGSPHGGGSASHEQDWGTPGGDAPQLPSSATQAPVPPPAAPEPATADDWRSARANLALKGYSRASGRPPSPPSAAQPRQPAATLLSNMANSQRATQAAMAQQRQTNPQPPPHQPPRTQQPPGRVPMPQPHPYSGAPSIMSGRNFSGGSGHGGDWGMPHPGPAAHPPHGAPPPARSMSYPVPGAQPSKGDPGAYSAWMNWASEAGMVPKVATTIAANIHQSPLGNRGGGDARYGAQPQPHPDVVASLNLPRRILVFDIDP
ncbi:hypothetical protein BXZ70DRAFT_396137 [Cristinia sonorae]|uniref:Uncharacterized protein n=1 Tax=Cristinia sonorae TaxID=1940300 RepID=A0A8K0UWN7_9AGAR|nr:hypothetical protein BXZ70DRAFT_396137 [Cristinia sonorae]